MTKDLTAEWDEQVKALAKQAAAIHGQGSSSPLLQQGVYTGIPKPHGDELRSHLQELVTRVENEEFTLEDMKSNLNRILKGFPPNSRRKGSLKDVSKTIDSQEAIEKTTDAKKEVNTEDLSKTTNVKGSADLSKTTNVKDSVQEPEKATDSKEAAKEPTDLSKTTDSKKAAKETADLSKSTDSKEAAKETADLSKSTDSKEAAKETADLSKSTDSKEAAKETADLSKSTDSKEASVNLSKTTADAKEAVKEPADLSKTTDAKEAVKEPTDLSKTKIPVKESDHKIPVKESDHKTPVKESPELSKTTDSKEYIDIPKSEIFKDAKPKESSQKAENKKPLKPLSPAAIAKANLEKKQSPKVQVIVEESASQETERTEGELVIKGVKLSSAHPKREDARIKDVIIARHVNPNRDQDVGVPLSKFNLNYVFQEKDKRDQKYSVLYGETDTTPLPSKLDFKTDWGAIFDQLDIGSCVGNSVSYSIRYCFKKQKMGDFTPSRLFIYYNGRLTAGYPVKEDTGMTIRDGYKSVTKYSVCGENNWPYIPTKFSQRPPESCYVAAKQHKTFKYIALDNTLDQMKRCLKDGYPISFGAALFDSFMSANTAKTGIIPIPDPKKEKRIGGHAMTIIGYDDSKKAFLVSNSWGAKWGVAGCCWFPYSYMINDDYVGDMWSPRWFGA